MTRRSAPPPPPAQKLHPTQAQALTVAELRNCPVCGFRLHAEQDVGGWRLFCNNDRGHRT